LGAAGFGNALEFLGSLLWSPLASLSGRLHYSASEV
jgi:hypothetical protein